VDNIDLGSPPPQRHGDQQPVGSDAVAEHTIGLMLAQRGDQLQTSLKGGLWEEQFHGRELSGRRLITPGSAGSRGGAPVQGVWRRRSPTTRTYR
jgi:hypothetical protein